MMLNGFGSMALVAVAVFGLLAGAEAFEVGRFQQREAVDLCKEKSVTAVSCSAASTDGLIAHPDDCRLFYKCAQEHGAVCVACPAGLHFNPALRVCDHPARAGCDPALLAPPPDHAHQHGDNIPQRCIDNSVTPVSCADADAPESLVAHPDDCQLFYYCVSAAGAPVCRQCPAGLHFNPAKRVCDNPTDAGCVADQPTNAFLQ